MRRTPRLIAAAVLIAFTGVLGGCSSFDPSDMLDFLDTKKKLPGDRKPVFPEGVPGLEQGVPKELYKGAQQQPDPNAPAVAALPAEPPPEPARPAKGAKAKQTRQSAAAPAEAPAGEIDGEAQPEAAPPTAAPPPKHKIVRKRTTAPPPDQPVQQAQPAQATQQQSQSAFPAPLPSGSFSR
ncbi:hypothetical protein [Bradyrhizobium liaoningense]